MRLSPLRILRRADRSAQITIPFQLHMSFSDRCASSSWPVCLWLVTGLGVALALAAGGALAQAPESSQVSETAPATPELPPPPLVSAVPTPEPAYAPAPNPAAPPPMDATVSVPILSHPAQPPLAPVTASVTARRAPATASAGTGRAAARPPGAHRADAGRPGRSRQRHAARRNPPGPRPLLPRRDRRPGRLQCRAGSESLPAFRWPAREWPTGRRHRRCPGSAR